MEIVSMGEGRVVGRVLDDPEVRKGVEPAAKRIHAGE
jgi:hypothetical protein